jgi:hypothetical protein
MSKLYLIYRDLSPGYNNELIAIFDNQSDAVDWIINFNFKQMDYTYVEIWDKYESGYEHNFTIESDYFVESAGG